MYRKATPNDVTALTELFWENLSSQPSYISHGEIQMGIADEPGVPAPDGKKKWAAYITEKIAGPDSYVRIYEEPAGIKGFVVAEIASDNDKPFGVICDLIVRPGQRGKGIGQTLLNDATDWLASRNINDFYLESGVENRPAHAFFEKQGFKIVSHIFKR